MDDLTPTQDSPSQEIVAKPASQPRRPSGLLLAALATSAVSIARITLAAGDDRVTLLLDGVLHVRMDTSESRDDFVDVVTLLQLPQHGPWPEPVRHLLHHHSNRRGLTWLRTDGPRACLMDHGWRRSGFARSQMMIEAIASVAS